MTLPGVDSPLATSNRLSFRTLVLAGTVGLVLGGVVLTATLLTFQARQLVDSLSRALLGQQLQHVRNRVNDLLIATARQGQICTQLTPTDGLQAKDFVAVFSRLSPAFSQQSDLSYIGYGTEETGEYVMLERLSPSEFRLREYIVLAEGNRVIRDYRPTATGFELIQTRPADDYDPRERPFYRVAKKAGGPTWTEAYPFLGNEKHVEAPGITHAIPFYGSEGKLRGVWDIDFDTFALSSFLKSQANESPGYAFVIEEKANGEHTLIAHPDATKVLDDNQRLISDPNRMRDSVVSAFLKTAQGPFRERSDQMYPRIKDAHGTYLTAAETVFFPRLPPWLIVVVLPENYAIDRFDEGREWALVLMGALGGVTVLFAIWLARRLARPVERLRATVDGLAGNFSLQTVPVEGPFELARLASAFNAMVVAVDARRRELLATNLRLQEEVRQRKLREAELEAVFLNVPMEMWSVDHSGHYSLQNQSSRDHLGDCAGKRPEEMNFPRETLEQLLRDHRAALSGELVRRETTEQVGEQVAHFHRIVAPIRMNGLVTGVLGVSIDVTERRRAEDALMRSQQRLRIHLENTPLAVIDWSVEFTVLSWNPAAESMFGWSTAEALGRHGLFIVPEPVRSEVRNIWADLLQNRGGVRNYNQNIARDGRLIECEWYNTILTDDDGNVIGVSSLVLDVSQRVSAEALFRESEERFLKSFQASPVAKAISRREDGLLLDVNDRFAQLIDGKRDEIIGLATAELNYWNSPVDYRRFSEKLQRDGEVRDFECRLKPRTGTPVDVLISASLVPLGEALCLLLTFVDISERKAAENALRESQRFLAALVNQLPGMVYRCRNDSKWSLTFVSDGANEVTGYPPVDLEHGRKVEFTSLIHPDDRIRLRNEVQFAFENGQRSFSYEYRLFHRDGEMRWVLERGEGQMDEHGRFANLVGFITDITERKRAEEEVLMLNLNLERRVEERTNELAQANEKLKELDRLKSEFLATMSHELRTPLNSIIGFSTILGQGLAGPLNREQQKQIEMVTGSARHLLTLINDLLDLSRVEAGRMDLFEEEFSLYDLVSEVERMLAPMFTQKKITYVSHVRERALMMRGDRKRIFQVLLNLANNAVKFTERGGVTVRCEVIGSEVSISVQDTGMGIMPEHIPMLFEAFRQIEGSARRVYEGTGLGLNLCKKLLELLGGRIAVESNYGQGSCFTLFLPQALPSLTSS